MIKKDWKTVVVDGLQLDQTIKVNIARLKSEMDAVKALAARENWQPRRRSASLAELGFQLEIFETIEAASLITVARSRPY